MRIISASLPSKADIIYDMKVLLYEGIPEL